MLWREGSSVGDRNIKITNCKMLCWWRISPHLRWQFQSLDDQWHLRGLLAEVECETGSSKLPHFTDCGQLLCPTTPQLDQHQTRKQRPLQGWNIPSLYPSCCIFCSFNWLLLIQWVRTLDFVCTVYTVKHVMYTYHILLADKYSYRGWQMLHNM